MDTLKAVLKTLAFPFYLVGTMLAFLLVPGSDLVLSAHAAGGENIGHVSRIRGAAYAVQGAELRELAVNELVRRSDVIKTGPDARVELTMLDETKLTLGADTELGLVRFDLGRQAGAGAVLLRLVKGAFRVATGRLEALRAQREEPFEVETPLAVIGIRGTDFWGGYLSADELSVLLISGGGVYIRNGAGRSEIVKPLEGVRLTSATAPPPAPTLWNPDRRARAFKTVSFD
jgi:hypothetical protein